MWLSFNSSTMRNLGHDLLQEGVRGVKERGKREKWEEVKKEMLKY